MALRLPHIALALPLIGAVAACDENVTRDVVRYEPGYVGVTTRLLQEDLVNFHVTMTGARATSDVHDYAECAAAQYALIRGYGFARHVRTQIEKSGETWAGDAVYLISAALPRGLKTIDAEVTVSNCDENGIPTV